MNKISTTYSKPALDDENFTPETLTPLPVPDRVEDWQGTRKQILEAWQAVVGRPSSDSTAAFDATDGFDRSAEIVTSFEQEDYVGTVLLQPTTPTTRQTVLLMTPKAPVAQPCPGMVIPFYDPDRMAGIDLRTQNPLLEEASVIQFGRHLAAQGYVVVCPEVYPFNTVVEPADNSGMNWWQAAADQLRADHPDWTGVGRLAWDASRALDLLLEQPGVDTTRCGVMGHSLGGKIAFYAAALDTRFAACVPSDFGFGFNFTNWDDDWYLGDRIHQADFDRAHHELLALIAPRPFFLVGGEADRPASWHYIQEAQRVYTLHGKEHGAGFFHHGAGHRPTEQAVRIAYGWLAEQFGLDIDPEAVQL